MIKQFSDIFCSADPYVLYLPNKDQIFTMSVIEKLNTRSIRLHFCTKYKS